MSVRWLDGALLATVDEVLFAIACAVSDASMELLISAAVGTPELLAVGCE